MKTKVKNQKNKSKKKAKKSLLSELKFLVLIFACVFGILGGAAINAASANTGTAKTTQQNETRLAYTSVFYFKASTLNLNTTSEPNTSFLVIANQDAIIGKNIIGSSIAVSTSPFRIEVLDAGQSTISLTARLKDGSSKTITATVIVSEDSQSGENNGNTNTEDNSGNSGTETENNKNGEDGTPSGNEETGGETENFVDYKLSYEHKSASSMEIVFSLSDKSIKTNNFILSAEVLTGDVEVYIMGNAAYLIFGSANYSYSIIFFAQIDGKTVAQTIVTY